MFDSRKSMFRSVVFEQKGTAKGNGRYEISDFG